MKTYYLNDVITVGFQFLGILSKTNSGFKYKVVLIYHNYFKTYSTNIRHILLLWLYTVQLLHDFPFFYKS